MSQKFISPCTSVCKHSGSSQNCPNCNDQLCSLCSINIDNSHYHQECSASVRHDIKLIKELELATACFTRPPYINYKKRPFSERKTKCAFSIEFETTSHFCSVTMWSSGEIEFDHTKIDGEEYNCPDYSVLSNKEELYNYIKEVEKYMQKYVFN